MRESARHALSFVERGARPRVVTAHSPSSAPGAFNSVWTN